MTLLSTPQARRRCQGCLSTSTRVSFSRTTWWVLHGRATTLALVLPLGFAFPFSSTRRRRRGGCWRNARGKSSTSFAEGDDGQVATCQLDVVEALASIKIGCKGTVVLLSLLLRVYRRNFITIVGCIIVKPSGVLLIVPMVRGRLIVGR